MRFGMHLSVGKGIDAVPELARRVGADTYQVFVDSPSSWSYSGWDPAKTARFRERRAELGQGPVVVHTGYLINLGGPKADVYAHSLAALAAEFAKATAIGADYLVLHPGKHLGTGREAGLKKIGAGLARVMGKNPAGAPVLLLEYSEGSGTCLGTTFEELAFLLDGLDREGKGLKSLVPAGVCLDTAHLWGAGYDLSTPDKVASVLDAFDRVVGLDRLGCFHLNDSVKELGSHTDRHAYLGEGKIGLEPFRALVRDVRLEHVAMILEKTGRDEDHCRELIRSLRSLAR
ncbi:MAG: deoxyribonuclease IV [bacterium]|nr:deoxyribonuclease IV [bacterium]